MFAFGWEAKRRKFLHDSEGQLCVASMPSPFSLRDVAFLACSMLVARMREGSLSESCEVWLVERFVSLMDGVFHRLREPRASVEHALSAAAMSDADVRMNLRNRVCLRPLSL